jgi:hypothetical protein
VAGLAAAGVDDAAAGVPSLEPQRELAVGLEVEGDAALAQLAHRRRRLLDQRLHRGGPAEAPAGGDRVGRVLGRGVARLQGGGEPALGPEAGALGERRARDHADRRAGLGRAQRGPQPGRPAADDGDVAGALCRYRLASRLIVSI